MSDGMPLSWKYLTSVSNRLSSFKGYLQSQQFPEALQRQLSPRTEERQTWKQWAGQKIGSTRNIQGQERLALFPGWATRRYSDYSQEGFEVDIFVSGFATVKRAPEMASRSQKAFIKLAKGFASLPKLEDRPESAESMVTSQASRSTEELLSRVKLPPKPSEVSDHVEVEALEQSLQQLDTSSQTSSDASDSEADFLRPLPAISHNLRKLHENLESRLAPFWSSVLPNRRIRIHIFTSLQQKDSSLDNREPVSTREFLTGADGSFEARFKLSWAELCHHPEALHIAFGEPSEEHELLVVAELLPPPTSPQSVASSSSSNLKESSSNSQARRDVAPPVTYQISLTHAPLRVISDIDDTVKHSGVTSGARVVFRNVFVKELSDLVIPGIGPWYSGMWDKGVRFHYVSNGPFEILPILGDFFQIAQLPPGSLKLKSYAGRSLFTGLLSAPSGRKRAGVVDVLESFQDSRFILIGDSGEQDLELYSELAKEKPHQIAGVFIRQVDGDPLDDPIGMIIKDEMLRSASSHPSIPEDAVLAPKPKRSLTDSSTPRLTIPSLRPPPASKSFSLHSPDYFSAIPLSSEPEEMDIIIQTPKSAYSATSTRIQTPRTPSTSSSLTYSPLRSASDKSTYNTRMSEAEKKRYDLQLRVYGARMMIPRHIPFRVFNSPTECIELDYILASGKQ